MKTTKLFTIAIMLCLAATFVAADHNYGLYNGFSDFGTSYESYDRSYNFDVSEHIERDRSSTNNYGSNYGYPFGRSNYGGNSYSDSYTSDFSESRSFSESFERRDRYESRNNNYYGRQPYYGYNSGSPTYGNYGVSFNFRPHDFSSYDRWGNYQNPFRSQEYKPYRRSFYEYI